MIDWTDETPRPLDELAKLAFPSGGVDAGTLKRRARSGRLNVSRPGKAFLASLRDIHVMLELCRVAPTQKSKSVKAMESEEQTRLSNLALDATLARVRLQSKRPRER